MPFFNDSDEALKYLGGVFRKSNETEVGPKLASAEIDLQVYYSDPDAQVLIKMRDGKVEVFDDEEREEADVKLYMPADIGDKFWRGEYNLAVGLAKGQVKAKGPVNKILKLVPLTKPLFPIYRDLVADKDAATA
jgi:putative sterol carrier protein